VSGTLSPLSQDIRLVQRVAELEEAIHALRSNQVLKISYGSSPKNIVIDGSGTLPVITVGGTNGIILTVDTNGMGIITMGNITMKGDGTIIVSDGTYNRVLIGKQVGGF